MRKPSQMCKPFMFGRICSWIDQNYSRCSIPTSLHLFSIEKISLSILSSVFKKYSKALIIIWLRQEESGVQIHWPGLILPFNLPLSRVFVWAWKLFIEPPPIDALWADEIRFVEEVPPLPSLASPVSISIHLNEPQERPVAGHEEVALSCPSAKVISCFQINLVVERLHPFHMELEKLHVPFFPPLLVRKLVGVEIHNILKYFV